MTDEDAARLSDLCRWAFGELGEPYVQELSDTSAWIFVLKDDGELECWRANLNLIGRWTLSPVY